MGVALRIYERLPVFLQNAAYTLTGLSRRRERHHPVIRRKLPWLRQSEWWPADEIRRYQDQQVRRIVEYAWQNVPFYRCWLGDHGVEPGDIRCQEDLLGLPVLTKAVVRENQSRMVSRELAGRPLVSVTTSGSTGTPLRIRMTRSAWAFQWAIWWRHRARFGISTKDRGLVVGGGAGAACPARQSRPPFWRYDRVSNHAYLSLHHLAPAKLPAIAEWLSGERFDFYAGSPAALVQIADWLIDHGVTLRCPPRCVCLGINMLTPAWKQRMERAFAATVSDQYGMAEFAGNLSRCEHDKYHLDFECCSLEMQPLAAQADGLGRLVFTGWGNPAMPFIRYDVGDFGRISSRPCECGRASMCLDAIEGRTNDYVYTPDGRKVLGMAVAFLRAPGAREIQIYQPAIDSIKVRLVPGAEYVPADWANLLSVLRERLGKEMKIDLELVDSIPRTASGKVRAVISELAEREPAAPGGER